MLLADSLSGFSSQAHLFFLWQAFQNHVVLKSTRSTSGSDSTTSSIIIGQHAICQGVNRIARKLSNTNKNTTGVRPRPTRTNVWPAKWQIFYGTWGRPKERSIHPPMVNNWTCGPTAADFLFLYFFIFVFYKNIFLFSKFTGIYPGRPAAGRAGPGRPAAGRQGLFCKNFRGEFAEKSLEDRSPDSGAAGPRPPGSRATAFQRPPALVCFTKNSEKNSRFVVILFI